MAAPIAMPASLRPGTLFSSSGRVIQARAVRANTIATRFSAGRMRPSSARRRPSSSLPPGISASASGKEIRVRISQQSGSPTSTSGTPSSIHWAKPMVTP